MARRFAAMVYDTLLLLALLMICALPMMPLLPEGFLTSATGHWLVRGYALSISFVFFSWFWVHGGQTLGMRAWRMRLVSSATHGTVNWSLASRRFLAAILSWLPVGLGFVWSLFDRDGLAWHDRLSQTQLRLEPKTRLSHPPQQDQTS